MKQNENDFNEIYKGITRIVKTKEHDEDVWFAVIGNTIVSRGTFKTKEEGAMRTNLATRLIINFLQKIITKLTRRKREIMVTKETKTIVITRRFSCSGVLTIRRRTKKTPEIEANNKRNARTA